MIGATRKLFQIKCFAGAQLPHLVLILTILTLAVKSAFEAVSFLCFEMSLQRRSYIFM